MGYFCGWGRVKNCFGVSLYRLITLFSDYCSIYTLSCSFEFVVEGGGWVVVPSDYLNLNPTIVLLVLLLGLWFGCDKKNN